MVSSFNSTSSVALSSQKITLPEISELYDPNFLDALVPLSKNPSPKCTPSSTPVQSNTLINALLNDNRTYTDNGAQAWQSTNSPTLDAFQSLGQWSYSPDVEQKLAAAWNEDSELTLKIIWNLRSIHDGKSAKETFYRAFGWLYNNHPRTAILNLPMLIKPICKTKKTKAGGCSAHGYWKDLLNILALASVDELSGLKAEATFLHAPRVKGNRGSPKKRTKSKEKDASSTSGLAESLKKDAERKVRAKALRKEENAKLHKQLTAKLAEPKFRALYIAVARLFSDQLCADIQTMNEIDNLPADGDKYPLLKRMSLAGKWAPTPLGSHDRVTNISTAIALLLHHSRCSLGSSFTFPSQLPPSPDASDSSNALLLRSFYQQHVLSPLRRVTRVPEPLMSANRWKEINYSFIPSVCMKNNSDHFYKHDPTGFEKYLISVEEGKRTISGANLLPHELVHEAYKIFNKVNEKNDERFPALQEMRRKLAGSRVRVVEAQWKTLIEKLRESGSLDNSLAICDVSGSMGYFGGGLDKNQPEPIYPAIALSLVLAQLARPPFNNAFITFSHQPNLVKLDPESGLANMVITMSQSDWGMNTNFSAVFLDLILPLAVQNNIRQEDMIKRLFVFSDMQFDDARTDNNLDWATNHDVIETAYKKAGYEVPEIVYWNLSGGGTFEVTAEREGVAMMSGFSPGMLKVFMGEEAEEEEGWDVVADEKQKKDKFNPVEVMKKALRNESYSGLEVFD